MAAHDAFRAEAAAAEALVRSAGPVEEVRVVHLPGNVPPWTDTGLHVEAGDQVSWFATGRVTIDEARGLWLGPTFSLWGRIGDGPIFKATQATTSFTADRAGPVRLAVYNGEWATPQGDLATPVEGYAALGGGFDVLLVRWRGAAAEGLADLLEYVPADGLIAAEAARLASPVPRPPGWRYLWFLGEGNIFRPAEQAGHKGIAVRTDDDVGILQRPVAVPLTPTTELAWSWKLDELPSPVAEDSVHTHDYLSIAVEFENGQDLTYYWSAALPEGRHFRCPLPTWTPRETHMVIRSGPAGLGRWHDERRRIAADYAEAIGGPMPERIVAVWLIAVSIFGHRRGSGMFADIALADGAARTLVA